MLQYAAYVGDWSEYRGSYRRQPLPGGDHTALGDALACLALIKAMAKG
jgi:DNA polymerase-3 subunit epsilon